MKLDLIVYGRGQERLDGYQLFAAPSYWSDEMLLRTGAFNDLWTQGDLMDSEPEAYKHDRNPWGKTYMFFYQKSPYCCAFLRCTRVEGDEPGTWLKEARNCDIWSMEGVCCPFENREEFFAMLPSVILWLEQNNSSLYRRLKDGEIGKSIEIPYQYFYNPYDIINKQPPEILDDLFSNPKAADQWLELCKMICFTETPFRFIFGPFSSYFFKNTGNTYNIEKVFSTVDDIENEYASLTDPFDNIEFIEKKTINTKIRTCDLFLKFSQEKKDSFSSYKYVVSDINNPDNPSVLESNYRTIRDDSTLDLMVLEAEAETIRGFARRINWGTSDTKDDITNRYRFEVEEQKNE